MYGKSSIMESAPIRELRWVGRSLADLKEFPEDVQDVLGYALHVAQTGGKHPSAKPLRGDPAFTGAGVLEVVDDYDADASDLTLMPRPLPVKLPGLHYWRTQRRLSQLALALQATLTARTIHALEHGSGATPETVRRLADALDVPPSDLLRQPPPAS